MTDELEQPEEQPVDELFKDRVVKGSRLYNWEPEYMGPEYTEDFLYIRKLTPQEQWNLHDRLCVLEGMIGNNND